MQKSEADIISQAGAENNIPCQIIMKGEEEFQILMDDKLQIVSFEAAKYIINGFILEKSAISSENEESPPPVLFKFDILSTVNSSLPTDEGQRSLKVDNKEELFKYPTILVFTSQCNVYKVKNTKFNHLTQVIDHSEMEAGEKPIYITGIENYNGFLIVAFENGKVGKITMESFQTEFNRKKLKGAFNGQSRLVYIERIEKDIDLVAISNINKVVLFNTSQINPVGSRTTMGVQVMKSKDRSLMSKMKRLDHVKLQDPEYYRKAEGLNVVGFYLKEGDEV